MDQFDFDASGLTHIVLDEQHGLPLSQAAFDLYVFTLAWSVRDGDGSGVVPDARLAELDVETTLTALELWMAGLWERVDGGYELCDVHDISRLQTAVERFKAVQKRLDDGSPPAMT